MEFTLRLTEEQINFWAQALLEWKLSHIDSAKRAELLLTIQQQASAQRREQSEDVPMQSPGIKTNGQEARQ